MKTIGVLLTLIVALNNSNCIHGLIGRPLADLIPMNRSTYHKYTLPIDNIDSPIMRKPLHVRGGGGSSTSSLEMGSNPLLTSLAPKVGIITSTLLYFSPMAAVRTASNDGTIGNLNPIPLAIMAVSSICWLVYGLSIRDPYVTLSNVPGSIASIWYVTAILPLLKGGDQLQTTQKTVVALSALTINLWTYLSLTNKSMVQITQMLGS